MSVYVWSVVHVIMVKTHSIAMVSVLVDLSPCNEQDLVASCVRYIAEPRIASFPLNLAET